MKCLKPEMLKAFLTNFGHTLNNKPNGQNMYTFVNGLVLNVYETDSVFFQRNETDGEFENQVKTFIESVNAPFKK